MVGMLTIRMRVIVTMMMTMTMITTTIITHDVDPSTSTMSRTANVTFKFQASFIPKVFFILLLTSI